MPARGRLSGGRAEALPSGGVSLRLVAGRLGYGERTLQRRLQERGMTLQDLVSEIRQSAAERLLADRHLSIEDVAMLLGFADPTGLRRAYRRWFGQDLRRPLAGPKPNGADQYSSGIS